MLGFPSVLAVLASLVILHSPSESAEVLDIKCGKTRTGQSPQTVGPWTALLHLNGRIVCAGTLIHSSFILTAAHCIRKGESLQVRLGEYGRVGAEQPENFEVDLAFQSRFYNDRSHESDIGMLRLSWPVRYKDYISPICIRVAPPRQIEPNSEFTGTGWNRVHDKHVFFHSMPIQVVAPTECRITGHSVQNRTRFCARNAEAGSCEGPSGSALSHVVNNRTYQIGIASYNELDCQDTRVYTHVLSFSSWIQRILRLYGRTDDQPGSRPATSPNVFPTTSLPTTTPPPTTTTPAPTPRYMLATQIYVTTKKSNFPQWDNQSDGFRNDGFRNAEYQNGGYQNGEYQNGRYQNGGYQNGGYQNTGYQNAGYPSAGYQDDGYRRY